MEEAADVCAALATAGRLTAAASISSSADSKGGQDVARSNAHSKSASPIGPPLGGSQGATADHILRGLCFGGQTYLPCQSGKYIPLPSAPSGLRVKIVSRPVLELVKGDRPGRYQHSKWTRSLGTVRGVFRKQIPLVSFGSLDEQGLYTTTPDHLITSILPAGFGERMWVRACSFETWQTMGTQMQPAEVWGVATAFL